MIQLIVFLPLLAAGVAGLSNRAFGVALPKLLTTGALFASCALSWPIFLGFVFNEQSAYVAPVFNWVTSGTMSFDWALRVDSLTASVKAGMYQTYLTRAREVAERQGIDATNVRVISPAMPPQAPIWPPRTLILLALGGIGGLASGHIGSPSAGETTNCIIAAGEPGRAISLIRITARRSTVRPSFQSTHRQRWPEGRSPKAEL